MNGQLTVGRSPARLAAALLLSAALTSAPRAKAEQPADDPSVLAAARSLAVDGVKLAQSGKCSEAIDKLERAEKLHHSAIVLEQLGECYIEQGRIVEGAEAMRAVVREGEPSNASDAMKKAHASARTMLESTKDKIASLTITVDIPNKAQPTVEIDGQPMPAALIGAARPTDPGEHTIEASAAGYLSTRKRINLAAGQNETVELSLVVDPNAVAKPSPAERPEAADGGDKPAPVAPNPTEAAAPLAATAPASSSGPNHLPAYIAWGVAGAALTVGVAYGWVAMNQKSDLDKVCPQHRCPPAQSERLDAAKANGVISSVAFGVGVGAAIAGGILFFFSGESEPEPQPRAASVHLGPGAAELEVKF
jgi:hypothetical protein